MKAHISALLFIALSSPSPAADKPEVQAAETQAQQQRILNLFAADPTAKKPDRALAKIVIPRGAGPAVWLSVAGSGPVPELPCMDNKLETCPSLYFLVSGPGLEKPVKVHAKVEKKKSDKKSKPAPLSAPSTQKLVLLNRANSIFDIFNRGGTYKIQAAVGNWRSNSLPVFVDKSLPPVADAVPRKKPKKVARIPIGAVWKPGDSVIARQDARGQLTWKTKLREPITSLVQRGDEWIATSGTGKSFGLDIATGRMLWKK